MLLTGEVCLCDCRHTEIALLSLIVTVGSRKIGGGVGVCGVCVQWQWEEMVLNSNSHPCYIRRGQLKESAFTCIGMKEADSGW